MRRVVVFGCGGAGKSTFSRSLGEPLDLPVTNLDRLYCGRARPAAAREQNGQLIRSPGMAVAFLLYVIAEVAAIWAVGSVAGVLGTLGLLLAGAFLGSWLARREGVKAARAFMETARAGRPAHAEITDGMLVALGGVLIMLPGFVSDIAGLLLLLSPTRAVFRRRWLRRIEQRAVVHANRTRGPVVIVDSEVVSEDKPQRPRPIIDR